MGICMFMRKGSVHTKPGSRLPSGYTELEYIESTGEQYIDTEVTPNQDTGVSIDFQMSVISGWKSIYGARKTNANVDSYQLWHTGTAFGFYYASKNTTWSGLNGTARHSIVANKNTAVANGTASVSLAYSAFTTNYPMFLFAANTAGSVESTGDNVAMKLYSCQIYDNGTLVRDFVPAMNSSGVVGLYDRVTASFFGNAGTGTFTAGPEVA